MNHIHLHRTFSTNNYLRELLQCQSALEEYTYITAYEQTAGRGQRGNSWEALAGNNLSLSLLLRPEYRADITPFDLNIITSLALYELLSKKLTHPNGLKVKWPNDILIDHKKIAGILTENEWLGNEWEFAIVGIGLNVHQKTFGDYNPKATSIDLENESEGQSNYEEWHHSLALEVVQLIKLRMEMLYRSPDEQRSEYHEHLYRYQEVDALFSTPDGRQFYGTIIGVEPNGLLLIQEGARVHRFAFKEVQFK